MGLSIEDSYVVYQEQYIPRGKRSLIKGKPYDNRLKDFSHTYISQMYNETNDKDLAFQKLFKLLGEQLYSFGQRERSKELALLSTFGIKDDFIGKEDQFVRTLNEVLLGKNIFDERLRALSDTAKKVAGLNEELKRDKNPVTSAGREIEKALAIKFATASNSVLRAIEPDIKKMLENNKFDENMIIQKITRGLKNELGQTGKGSAIYEVLNNYVRFDAPTKMKEAKYYSQEMQTIYDELVANQSRKEELISHFLRSAGLIGDRLKKKIQTIKEFYESGQQKKNSRQNIIQDLSKIANNPKLARSTAGSLFENISNIIIEKSLNGKIKLDLFNGTKSLIKSFYVEGEMRKTDIATLYSAQLDYDLSPFIKDLEKEFQKGSTQEQTNLNLNELIQKTEKAIQDVDALKKIFLILESDKTRQIEKSIGQIDIRLGKSMNLFELMEFFSRGNVDSDIFSAIINTPHLGMFENEKENIELVLKSAVVNIVGFLMFDDWEGINVNGLSNGINRIQVMNLNGVYISLSTFLIKFGDLLKNQEKDFRSDVQKWVDVTVNNNVHYTDFKQDGWTPYPDEWEAKWNEERQKGLSQIRVSVKVLTHFQEYINTLINTSGIS